MDNFIFYMWIADVILGIRIFLFLISIFIGLGVLVHINDTETISRPSIISFLAATFIFFAALILPSKQTVHIFAMAKLGETAMASPIAEKVLNTVHTLLDEMSKREETEK